MFPFRYRLGRKLYENFKEDTVLFVLDDQKNYGFFNCSIKKLFNEKFPINNTGNFSS